MRLANKTDTISVLEFQIERMEEKLRVAENILVCLKKAQATISTPKNAEAIVKTA